MAQGSIGSGDASQGKTTLIGISGWPERMRRRPVLHGIDSLLPLAEMVKIHKSR
jgi:hypothetical protein